MKRPLPVCQCNGILIVLVHDTTIDKGCQTVSYLIEW